MSRLHLPDFLSRWVVEYTRWFALGIVVVILALGYVTVLAGKIETVRTEGLLRRAESAQQLKTDTEYRDTLVASATAYDRKISDADRATIEAFIPTGSDFPSLLLVVQDMARRGGLSLNNISVAETGQIAAAGTVASTTTAQTETAVAQAATVTGVNLRTQDISVTVNGIRSYNDVKGFVKVIESSRRLFDIVAINFNLSANPGATEGAATQGSPITFSLRTYYLPAAN